MQATLRYVFIPIFSLKWNLGQEQMEQQCLLSFRETDGSVFLWPSLMAGRGWKKLIASVLGGPNKVCQFRSPSRKCQQLTPCLN